MTAPPAQRHGRRTKLTADVHERIVAAVRAGATFEGAAGAAGIDESTLYRWLREAEASGAPAWKRQFRQDLYRARDEVEVRVVAGSVMKAAIGGYVVKRVTRTRPDGTVETEEQIAPADGRVGLELLARRFHDRWGRRQPIEVSGPGGGPIQVEHGATIADLAARLHAEYLGASGALENIVEGEIVDGE
ncbi:transposase [Microtetraspora fusca]|uniref:Transposase n=1 Tax=Microtetraspora fusca TaxID=1997 RepID=A0ABW6VIS6_MICFU